MKYGLSWPRGGYVNEAEGLEPLGATGQNPHDPDGPQPAPDNQAALRATGQDPHGQVTSADPAEPTEPAQPTEPSSAGDPPPSGDAERAAGRTATLYDVARIANVSTATVSRVVHGQDRVRETTRQRVLDVIERLGYVPDAAAQSLSRRRKDVIGLICVEHVGLAPNQYHIETMSLLFYDEVLRGVESRIRHQNLSVLVTYLQEDNDLDLPRLLALTGKVDGLLIGEGLVPSSVLAHLIKRLPVVIVAGDPGELAIDVVTADNRSGAAAVVTHLIADHGKRRLFHVDGPPSAPDAKERRLALHEVLRAHPQSRPIGAYNGTFSVQSGEEAAASLLAAHAGELPDAVVCANDQTAIGVLQAFAAAGVRVPEDVAVVGFDDIFVGGIFDPTLTTVHQPMRALGEQACDRLLERIAKPDLPPIVRLLPTELVLRRSCGCPPGTVTRLPVEPAGAEQSMPSDARPDDDLARATPIS